MYLRTTKRKNKDGSVVEYYQLAHNERHPVTRKPVAKIVHSFGRADQLDRDELVRLCRSIARVCGLAVVDPFEETHEESLKKSAGIPADMKIIRTLSMGSVMVIEKLQATEIRSGDYRFTVRNEIPADTRDILEKLAVPVPKQIISVAK